MLFFAMWWAGAVTASALVGTTLAYGALLPPGRR